MTSQSLTVSRTEGRERFTESASVLTRSFHDTPQFVAICPDTARREKMLRIFFRMALADALTHGRVDVALEHGRIVGVAVWLPPGHEVMTPLRQMKAALPMLRILSVAPRAFFRLTKLGAALGAAHPKEPHWYLVVLGVDTGAQRRGVGSRLVQEGVARADATGHGCYLETMLEQNVRLYQRHGFEVLRKDDGILPGGPPFWFMWQFAEGSM